MKPWFPFKDTATWKHKTGNNGEDDIYSSTTIDCDIINDFAAVRKIVGDEFNFNAVLHCGPEHAIVIGDVVTVDGRDWPVLQVQDEKDNNRNVILKTVVF